MPMSAASTNPPSSPGRRSTQIHPSARPPLTGKRKVTCTLTPAGTTLGVADPTSSNGPVPSAAATDRVTGSELWLSTVTFQARAFGGTGPAAGGNGVGSGVGVGKTGGGGRGEAGHDGGDTPAGMFSPAAPGGTQTPSTLQWLPPATRTGPSSSSVNEAPL